ncbi:hypothetical protein CONPUDRAFT_74151 [Coniophora puteana RWD-64-598 SS2]|uniref:Uncharacterized protein n=1 Tax=Coniophora puteana (strain RWD-64-598) TaxID=741705 RepID=A0A5M3MMA3_CONPW|nr:uncharacterized protein CONPUDRAFT_74151 [Coniophora puteana RWD-64-598 SS2]EIW79815.1 hypothetical protein CONPUDRAFT_74151 [Coniophora puteana RWD-64-598 SS2]
MHSAQDFFHPQGNGGLQGSPYQYPPQAPGNTPNAMNPPTRSGYHANGLPAYQYSNASLHPYGHWVNYPPPGASQHPSLQYSPFQQLPIYSVPPPPTQYTPPGLLSPRQQRSPSPQIAHLPGAGLPYNSSPHSQYSELHLPAAGSVSPHAVNTSDAVQDPHEQAIEDSAREAAMAACQWRLSLPPAGDPVENVDEDDEDDADEDDEDDEDEDASLDPPANESWSERNPNHPVLPTRAKRPPLTPEQKIERDARREQKAQRYEALRKDIHKLLIPPGEIERLHALHDIPVKTIEDMVFRMQDKKNRTVRLYNAKLHHEKTKITYPHNLLEGLTAAEKTKYLHAFIKAKAYTEEEDTEMLRALEEHRNRVNGSVRCSNCAASQEFTHASSKCIQTFDACRTHTGSYGAMFLVRGHVNDPMQPIAYATDNSEDFFERVFGKTLGEIARLYEQWACTQDENLDERERRNKLVANQTHCASAITEQLQYMTGASTKMNYKNYQKKIVETHGIKVVGWPDGMTMRRPHLITTVDDIRRLREALDSEKCYWESLDGKRNSKASSRKSSGKRKRQPEPKPAATKKGRKAASPKSSEFIDDSSEE